MIEVRTVRITWLAEIGYCDGGGIGKWESTKESVSFATKQEAESLRDEWLAAGKLEQMSWGEIRPDFAYGLFRIRRHEEVIAVVEGEPPTSPPTQTSP